MDNSQKTLVNLLNPSFEFSLGDKTYQIKKANIVQVQKYQLKVIELGKQNDIPMPIRDLEITSYAVYLVLSKVDDTVTQEYVKENMMGGIDALQLLADLGFIDPQKAELARVLQQKLISGNSSATSATEQDGLPTKSES